MSLRIVFELDAADIGYLRRELRKAREAVKVAEPVQIIDAARAVLTQLADVDVPAFVRQRLERLETIIALVEDADWRPPRGQRRRILEALAYFGDPEDLIADTVPGLGFLDDAIMVELVLNELQHDVEAYLDFCTRRDQLGGTDGAGPAGTERLAAERRRLQERAARRKRRDIARRGGDSPVSGLW